MSNLVLELRQGETMIVNGASIRFRTKCCVELTSRARFLFGKQIMAPDQVGSPARRIYYALQTAYIGSEGEREMGLQSARIFIAGFYEATNSEQVRTMLNQALDAAGKDDFYKALRLIRRVIQHEDAVRDPTRDIIVTAVGVP